MQRQRTPTSEHESSFDPKECQVRWLEQCRDDFRIYELLRQYGQNPRQILHYLQMATEKLAKAYLWRTGKAPTKSHSGFGKFFRALLDNKSAYTELGFTRVEAYQSWCRQTASPLAYEIESLAPSLANNGANPEYPWPHQASSQATVSFSFPLWNKLHHGAAARVSLSRISRAIDSFERYGFR